MVNTAMPATLKSFLVVDGEDELRRINQKGKEVHWEERVNIGLKSFITSFVIAFDFGRDAALCGICPSQQNETYIFREICE